MKTSKLLSTIMIFAAVVLFASCAAQKNDGNGKNVPYTVARNYFFASDVIPDNPAVYTQADFDRLYNPAAFMGKDGQPTQIDFSRQFVIGVVLPVTEDETEIKLGKLTRSGDTLTLEYKVKVGERGRSFSIQPVELVIVDNKYKAEKVVLKKTE